MAVAMRISHSHIARYFGGPIEWIQRMLILRMKYEKPMYSTRVIVDDLNPIWEESTA